MFASLAGVVFCLMLLLFNPLSGWGEGGSLTQWANGQIAELIDWAKPEKVVLDAEVVHKSDDGKHITMKVGTCTFEVKVGHKRQDGYTVGQIIDYRTRVSNGRVMAPSMGDFQYCGESVP